MLQKPYKKSKKKFEKMTIKLKIRLIYKLDFSFCIDISQNLVSKIKSKKQEIKFIYKRYSDLSK